MRTAIIALGSQGDVQPYVALGKGLLDAGHRVRLITHENYAGLVEGQGLEFWPVQGNVQEITESPELKALIEKGNFIAIQRFAAKASQEAALSWASEGLRACEDMDVLVAGVGGLYVALGLAEKLNLPLIQAYVFPFTPTSAFAGILFPRWAGRLGGAVNRLTHQLVRQALWQTSRTGDNAVREQVLGLPKAPFLGPYNSPVLGRHPAIYGFSPSVIPKPADWQSAEVTGYWFLEAAPNWTPPKALVDFLEAGPPPVYVGFGSMAHRDPEATAELVLEALRPTRQRAVMQSGWGGLKKADLPEHVFALESAPHTWLFPRMAAVVHHGGAGTTAAGLRAGVPSVIVPFFGDQPYWGEVVAGIGAGPRPIPRKRLSSEGLARAISETLNNPQMRQKAAQLGQQIRAEDGLGKAVRLIESYSARV
ncbi:MAG: glycosyltransferase [Meiothermus sp.]|nr:glycosyltransferase [Meiothermus sp.]